MKVDTDKIWQRFCENDFDTWCIIGDGRAMRNAGKGDWILMKISQL